ncbi:MAG: hypothetical protein M1114_05955 [Candidatus Dependentiae bacterium]|nr:hypothetical protein [Candidatus Dependentiae bacterium]
MNFRLSVLFIFCIGVVQADHIHNLMWYAAVSKSIDYTCIDWQGNIGKYQSRNMTAYIYRVEQLHLYLMNINIEGILFIHDKKTNKKDAYRREYWSREGVVFAPSTKNLLNSKSCYHGYKKLYRARKRSKGIG